MLIEVNDIINFSQIQQTHLEHLIWNFSCGKRNKKLWFHSQTGAQRQVDLRPKRMSSFHKLSHFMQQNSIQGVAHLIQIKECFTHPSAKRFPCFSSCWDTRVPISISKCHAQNAMQYCLSLKAPHHKRAASTFWKSICYMIPWSTAQQQKQAPKFLQPHLNNDQLAAEFSITIIESQTYVYCIHHSIRTMSFE